MEKARDGNIIKSYRREINLNTRKIPKKRKCDPHGRKRKHKKSDYDCVLIAA